MERKQIERESTETCIIERNIYNDNNPYYGEGFMDGALWRIESVWHDIDETPKQGELSLCINESGCAMIFGPDNDDFKNAAKELGFTRWAYIKDLIPEEKATKTSSYPL